MVNVWRLTMYSALGPCEKKIKLGKYINAVWKVTYYES